MPDHVHILVKVPTTVTIARLAQQMKGVSSRFVQEELAGDALFAWQAGYAVFSVGRNQTRPVMEYIRGQKEHHAAQTQHDAWETTDQPYLPRPQDDRREAS